MNSLKKTKILSLDSNLQALWLKIETGRINQFLVASIHRDNSIWKEYFKQSFGGSINAWGALDQKLQPINHENTAEIKICKIKI